MNKSKFSFLFLMLILACLTVTPAFSQAEKVFLTNFNSGDIPSIDQALVSDFIGIQLADELTVGLLRQNEENGELEPGMAVEWTASEDNLVYTFKLLEGIPWVTYNTQTNAVEEVKDCDGNVRTVTAQDFVYGTERTLRPATASSYAFLVNQAIVGAEDYNLDVTQDFSTVGIKAIDDATIEISFKEDGVFNLNIVSMWMMHAMPSWVIDGDACTEGLAERWSETGTYQGYGPFMLKEWTHDSHLILVKNPFWPGTDAVPQPKLDGVHYSLIGDVMALSEYEAGNMDYAIIPSGDYDRIITAPEYQDHLIYKPTSIGTEWLVYNPWLAPTDDVRVRQALNYAVDRQAVVDTVKAGEPAPYFVNPAVAGAPKPEDYPELGVGYDPEKAKALIDEYCAEKGIKPSDLTIVYSYNTTDAQKIRAETIQSMWVNTLGINVTLKNSDWAVFKVERNQGLDNVYRSSWVQDYMDANNFTADVFLCPGGAYQEITDWPSLACADLSNPKYVEYADVIKSAGKETDPIARAALYARGEEILIEEEAIINPLSWNNSYVLQNPRIIAPISVTGYERWEKWDIQD